MSINILHGDIVYAPSADELAIHENSYIVVKEGCVEGIYPEVPEQYKGVPVTDYGNAIILVQLNHFFQNPLQQPCLSGFSATSRLKQAGTNLITL